MAALGPRRGDAGAPDHGARAGGTAPLVRRQGARQVLTVTPTNSRAFQALHLTGLLHSLRRNPCAYWHDRPTTAQRGGQAEYASSSPWPCLQLLRASDWMAHKVSLENGLILVDTKYEFGKTSDGTIVLIDEVHTPDSNRYWIANSYEYRFISGLEPENVDKVLPEALEELVADFGLAKFTTDNNTHVSTRVMGTFGLVLPCEYICPCLPYERA
ncbi:Phosphoribosylaminoimidazole-succinocarboxamide synthase, chloroplastic [Zea mays]|uniref:phosphoribosylaminoimidazolesuccinocarboxamide synthase n=1 Tax=Zea mays TaxID=4577 RepID=A0A3L6D810_MAIZE|nr:Phosphoribosylaminoimidazole-succinocarboxamide synthase, chloroplastic [Zea mays]